MIALRLLGIALALIGGGMMLPAPPSVVDVKNTRLAAFLLAIGVIIIIVALIIK